MLRHLKHRIVKMFSYSPSRRIPENLAAIRRQLLGTCPACGRDLEGHHHWRLASVVLEPGAEAPGEVAKLIREREWALAAQFQDWKADRNEREYYVIRCPNKPELSLVAVISTADMWSDDRVESTQRLDRENTSVILDLVGDGWKPL